ncbi:MAG: penicillin-binding protein 2 [Dermatophilaceae bacterium]|nr:penicillin-binding protein 2 [Actinomycetales bacterium]MBP8881578.1 penicillin-binding protein 2 [Dermatophilaceae bacterium]MBP9919392.1 penicillin-binding protein 2 [Dermatophilaceae bacterium]
MNTPIIRMSRLIATLFAMLLVASTLIQFVQAPSLRARADNRRTLLDNYSRDRGSIVLTGDQAIAKSTPSPGELAFLRTYPQGELYAHVTGYYSYIYGSSALEATNDALLSGSSDALFYRRLADMLAGKQQTGASIQLTINAKAQAAAHAALGNRRGAVVALNPKTGAILAMVSHPAYDPSVIASHDATAAKSAMETLVADPTKPLTNRAIAGNLYPPGSVFKIVTAAAALTNGTVTETTQIPGPARMDLPQTSVGLPNWDRAACGPNDLTTLQHALEISCNTAFAWVGLKLGADALRAQAAKFGFGDESITVPMKVTASKVPADLNPPQLAQSSIGQYDVRVTPLQVAMVAAGIANRGVVMKPFLVDRVLGSNLDVIDQTVPQQYSQAVSSEVASQLTRMLVAVVDAGTGGPAKIAGVAVAGKSGTAQQGNGLPPHAWFTSFAPADNPQVAVAVVVEDGGNAGEEAGGSRAAGPIAKAVMEAVISR